MLVVFGVVIVGAGLVLMLVGRVPWLGRLPGATSILVSVVLSLLLYFVGRR